ncbi:MsnO8 family LLM class oxidoreductase [Brevibacterium sp. 5221]|uniref:MsnO8 family LLM class oxidoreductase n=1 Tax=Brevibacterium rongguiense TaxID=2695267 RepID=A0A6N9H5X7_9MICO|nr:MsnO8 family LLM class oxidoreductase [Brevibacterium rongguiense]
MALSVLDLIPVRGEQTTGQALAASRELVARADALGFTRYWVAEHHNMPSVASTTPGVELMYLGQGTERIRLGSGGVMLPNHAPLAVAEQFSLLAAVYGDRIDLGIGRAPGTDPITSAAMRGHLGDGHMVDAEGNRIDPVEQFPQHIMDILALLGPDGASVPLHGGKEHVLRATPSLRVAPQVWLLGSSGYSAQLAAALGLPYVFAHHFAGRGTEAALNLYRESFRPSQFGSEPRTFLTLNAVVADTQREADALAEPYLYSMANLRVGAPMTSVPLAGDDVAAKMTDGHRRVADALRDSWVIGDAAAAAEQIRQTAHRFQVDEVMIHPVAGAYPDEPYERAQARVRTLELLAGELRG